ncbi:hypothetical protein BGW41_004541 [Actinomortierella wolfii]|nr:hypothetical protein BGW41_004541 [Actinomortierella wolfii]
MVANPHGGSQDAVTIIDVLGQHHEFSKLLKTILKDKELTNLLSNAGNQLTLFAPTNEAFDSITDIRIPTRDLLLYHISPNAYNTTFLRVEPLIKSMYETPGLDGSAQYLRIAPEHPSIPSAITTPSTSFWRYEPEWTDQYYDGGSQLYHHCSNDDSDNDEVECGERKKQRIKREADELYINRAKVVVPDLTATSGGIVHGVNRIILPPGDTILDEIFHHSEHFSILTEAWAKTEVDVRIRDGKGLTLFAAPDKAWKALPKKLKKFLFSDIGREHLKIFTMYMIGDRTLYTPEIFNRTNDDGSKNPDYKDIEIQSLLNSPAYKLHVKGQLLRVGNSDVPLAETLESLADDIRSKAGVVSEAVRSALHDLQMAASHAYAGNSGYDKDNKHHYPHRNPGHRHHHDHKTNKHHEDHHHQGERVPRGFERNEIFVNKKARIEHGLENWIAGNGVIHVIDRVLMPPRYKGCRGMTNTECEAWQFMWKLASEEDEDEELVEDYFDEFQPFGKGFAYPSAESSNECLFGSFKHCGVAHDDHDMVGVDAIYDDDDDDNVLEVDTELGGGWGLDNHAELPLP